MDTRLANAGQSKRYPDRSIFVRFRLTWLFLLVFLAALGSFYFANYVFVPEIRKSYFDEIDGVFARAEYIHVDSEKNDRLYFRYGRISDSGVELERVVNGEPRWIVFVDPLGVPHNAYHHEVFVSIENNEIFIRSSASGGSFFQRLNLSDGSMIDRTQQTEESGF